MSVGIVFAVLLVIVALWVVAVSNRIVALQKACDSSQSGVDVQLKRRYDLIPNLVATVKGFAAHESAVLDRLTEARRAALAGAGSDDEVDGALRTVLATAERYPELTSAAAFRDLQQELVDTEDRIAAARRFHAANVREYEIATETFPGTLLGRRRTA